MFYKCNNLYYINLKNFDDSGIIERYYYYEQMFAGVPDNVIVCINETIELSKLYSEKSVTNMINAYMDKIYKEDLNERK